MRWVLITSQSIISTLALLTISSGFKLYSSSSNAARNVPGPLTFDRVAAISAAIVKTRTLHCISVGYAIHENETHPASAPSNISPCTSWEASSNGSLLAR